MSVVLWQYLIKINYFKLDVCGSVHLSITHIENPIRCHGVTKFYFIFIWSSTCFGLHTPHHQEPKTALAASGFAYVEGCWPCSCWTARPRTQHDCHHDTKVKPEAATAVIELLMMGGKTPETCWAGNKRQDNKLKNYCIWLVIYLNANFIRSSATESAKRLFQKGFPI